MGSRSQTAQAYLVVTRQAPFRGHLQIALHNIVCSALGD